MFLHILLCLNNIYNGRSSRVRTYDPLVPNQMRYQAALLPDSKTAINTNAWHLFLVAGSFASNSHGAALLPEHKVLSR